MVLKGDGKTITLSHKSFLFNRNNTHSHTGIIINSKLYILLLIFCTDPNHCFCNFNYLTLKPNQHYFNYLKTQIEWTRNQIYHPLRWNIYIYGGEVWGDVWEEGCCGRGVPAGVLCGAGDAGGDGVGKGTVAPGGLQSVCLAWRWHHSKRLPSLSFSFFLTFFLSFFYFHVCVGGRGGTVVIEVRCGSTTNEVMNGVRERNLLIPTSIQNEWPK